MPHSSSDFTGCMVPTANHNIRTSYLVSKHQECPGTPFLILSGGGGAAPGRLSVLASTRRGVWASVSNGRCLRESRCGYSGHSHADPLRQASGCGARSPQWSVDREGGPTAAQPDHHCLRLYTAIGGRSQTSASFQQPPRRHAARRLLRAVERRCDRRPGMEGGDILRGGRA